MPNSAHQNAELENYLAELSQNPIQQLRQRWRAVFRTEPPPAFGPDLLRRSIAQRIQEQRYGGLSAPAQRQLNQVVKAIAGKPGGRIELPRRIKPGAVLVRTWKRKTHRVTVADKSFTFEERTYSSLSEIAREITGTRWNGPRFFGLRPTEKSEDENLTNATTRKRGRPPKPPVPPKPATTKEVGHGL